MGKFDSDISFFKSMLSGEIKLDEHGDVVEQEVEVPPTDDAEVEVTEESAPRFRIEQEGEYGNGEARYIIVDQKYETDSDHGFTGYTYDSAIKKCAERNAVVAGKPWQPQDMPNEITVEGQYEAGSVIEYRGHKWTVERSEYVSSADAAELEDGFDVFLSPGWHTWLKKVGRKPGRPTEREGDYARITLEIRKDLLAKIDASGKSRREYIEQLLEQ